MKSIGYVKAFLDSQSSLQGNLSMNHSGRVDGSLVGNIRSQSTLIVGDGGEVIGNIYAQDVIICGYVSGNIYSENKIFLSKTAKIKGELSCQQVIVEQGAQIESSAFHTQKGSREDLLSLRQ